MVLAEIHELFDVEVLQRMPVPLPGGVLDSFATHLPLCVGSTAAQVMITSPGAVGHRDVAWSEELVGLIHLAIAGGTVVDAPPELVQTGVVIERRNELSGPRSRRTTRRRCGRRRCRCGCGR